MIATRKSKFAAVAVVGTVVLGGGTTAFASTRSTPAAGIVHAFVDTNGKSQTVDPTLFTGAIGDYGTSTSMTKSGMVNPNGNYEKVALTKGTFLINATKANTSVGKKAIVNKTTCSIAASGSGPAPLSAGTGLYKGISGTLTITETYAAVFPHLASGKCNFGGNVQPLKQYGSVSAVGKVAF